MLTLSEERKFHLIFARGSESSRERKYQREKFQSNGQAGLWYELSSVCLSVCPRSSVTDVLWLNGRP